MGSKVLWVDFKSYYCTSVWVLSNVALPQHLERIASWKSTDLSESEAYSTMSEISEELNQQYQAALATAKTTPPKELTQDQKLSMYGLFKQIEVGPCNTDRPGIFDQTGRYKHDAWSKLGTLSKEDAIKQYIAIVNEAYGL